MSTYFVYIVNQPSPAKHPGEGGTLWKTAGRAENSACCSDLCQLWALHRTEGLEGSWSPRREAVWAGVHQYCPGPWTSGRDSSLWGDSPRQTKTVFLEKSSSLSGIEETTEVEEVRWLQQLKLSHSPSNINIKDISTAASRYHMTSVVRQWWGTLSPIPPNSSTVLQTE